MTIALETAEELDHYRRMFERQPEEGPGWLKGLRRAALDRFLELGFPHTRMEEWRFTPIRPITETRFRHAEPLPIPEPLAPPFDDTDGWRVAIVNGRYEERHSRLEGLPAGVRIESLAEALRTDPGAIEPWLAKRARFQDHAFVALNTAFLADGAFIRIPGGVVLERPIHALIHSRPGEFPAVAHPRLLILAEEHSQATVVESYSGTGGVYLANSVTELIVAENAVVDHYKIQLEAPDAFHMATIQALLHRGASYMNTNVSLGARIARSDIQVYLGGEGAEATLNGLTVAADEQLIDNHTKIDHAMPHCPSHELYKGIWDGRSHGVFNGRIHVHPDAQKTDAKQTNQNILLSREAVIDTKPELEIYADDVRCTHGATIGRLSEDALFYLRARGIGREEARALLTFAFASEIIERIRVTPLRERLEEAIYAMRGNVGDVHEVVPAARE